MEIRGGTVKMKTSLFGLCALAGVALIVALIAQSYGLIPNFKGSASADSAFNDKTGAINVNASEIQFTPWELKTWLGIKDRLAVVNTDPSFTGNRVLQWISMRNSSSGDYYQKSMEFLCFWEGRGADGEWEAIVCIYNVPNQTNDFVVEVSRFTWHSLEVTLDDIVVRSFPQITNDTTSIGYASFHVTPL